MIGRGSVVFVILLTAGVLFNCNSGRVKTDLSDIHVDQVVINRYGLALFRLDTGNLKSGLQILSKDYSFFLGYDFEDTLNLIQIHNFITDPFNIHIASACMKRYPGLTNLEDKFTQAFRYYKYFLPDQRIPNIFTYISGLQYESPVNVLDSVMIIALDMYLGKDFVPYRQVGLPVYKISRMDRPYILPDCFKEIATTQLIPEQKSSTLLDMMVYHGKILYFLDAVMPEVQDSFKIGYTSNQLDWCRENEPGIWAFLIENELLYTTDYQEINKFIIDGPFTSGLPRESPSMLGRWMGWQIVRQYMNRNHNISLDSLFHDPDSQGILMRSRYKPKK